MSRGRLALPQAVVLAAGRGTRLGPLTAVRSKAMLPVAGQPLVGRVLARLWAAGLRSFIIVGGPGDHELAEFCASDASLPSSLQGSLSYVIQNEQRGMAHALAGAAGLIHGPFVLSACDNLVTSECIAQTMSYLGETGADGVLALLHMPPEKQQHSAAVELAAENRVLRIVEKPRPGSLSREGGASSIPLYALKPSLLQYLDVPVSPRGEQELQSAVQALIDAGGDVRGLFTPDRWTVTRPEDLLTLNLYYLEQGCDTGVLTALPSNVTVMPPVRIEQGAQIGMGCVIGPRVYLESGSQVGNGVVLRDAVVLRGAVVPDGDSVSGGIRGAPAKA